MRRIDMAGIVTDDDEDEENSTIYSRRNHR